MSSEDGRRVVQVTMQKAGYGLWERCFAAEIPQHVHEKASEYSCLRRHCPARCPPPLKSPLLAVGQLEAQGRKLVAAGQQAIAEKDWSAAEDSLAQAAEVWATMESRTRGAEEGSYAPYAAAASEALEEVRREKGKAAASARPVGGCSTPLSRVLSIDGGVASRRLSRSVSRNMSRTLSRSRSRSSLLLQ